LGAKSRFTHTILKFEGYTFEATMGSNLVDILTVSRVLGRRKVPRTFRKAATEDTIVHSQRERTSNLLIKAISKASGLIIDFDAKTKKIKPDGLLGIYISLSLLSLSKKK
jgi:hypothetical protein